ncbi:hypothetical protein [Saccharopolyspora gloriosae]|uniref:hypothetical protein n=1 Tax=Saccharopolyspora gloriosae TaxID=455344 RepID=UPI002867E6B9|nr:hypothetical protein [Saccharopolyspora gloriosae]
MTNPLVNAQNAADPAEPPESIKGIGIAESWHDVSSLNDGSSWIESGLAYGGLAMEAVSVVVDPIGTLLSYGLSWLIEHVQPLQDALDWFAGDPEGVQAYAVKWQEVAGSVNEAAGTYSQAVQADTAQWTGAAGDAYRRHAAEKGAALTGAGELAGTIATVVEAMGMVVSFVRDFVRDLIADCISRLITYALEALAPPVVSLAWVVPQAVAFIAKTVSKIADIVQKLLKTISNVSPKMARMVEVFGDIMKLLGKGGKQASEKAAQAGRVAAKAVDKLDLSGKIANKAAEKAWRQVDDAFGTDVVGKHQAKFGPDLPGGDSGGADSSGAGESGGARDRSAPGDSGGDAPRSDGDESPGGGGNSRSAADASDADALSGSPRADAGAGAQSSAQGSADSGAPDAASAPRAEGGSDSGGHSGQSGATGGGAESGGSSSGGSGSGDSGGSASGSSSDEPAHGGSAASGPASGGSRAGDVTPGGAQADGPASGGAQAEGSASGGAQIGDSASGGAQAGGPASGGSSTGAPESGGVPAGGHASGGSPSSTPGTTSGPAGDVPSRPATTTASGVDAPPRPQQPGPDAPAAPTPPRQDQQSPSAGGGPAAAGGAPGGAAPSAGGVRPGSGGWTGTPGSPGSARTPSGGGLPGPRAPETPGRPGGSRQDAQRPWGAEPPRRPEGPQRPAQHGGERPQPPARPDGQPRVPRQDGARPDAPRAPHQDAARAPGARPDAPRADGPQPRADAPRPGGPRPDAPRPGGPRPDAPRSDAPRPDGLRPDAPRPDTPRAAHADAVPNAPRPHGGIPPRGSAPHGGPPPRPNGAEGSAPTSPGHYRDLTGNQAQEWGPGLQRSPEDAPNRADSPVRHEPPPTPEPSADPKHSTSESMAAEESLPHSQRFENAWNVDGQRFRKLDISEDLHAKLGSDVEAVRATQAGISMVRHSGPTFGKVHFDRSLPRPAVDPKRFTVEVHGGPHGVHLGGKELNPMELAEVIRAAPGYRPGEPVRLLACRTGADTGDGTPNFAQELSKELGVEVVAPKTDAWVDNFGNIYASKDSASFDTDASGAPQPRFDEPGQWTAFRPDGTTAVHDSPYPPGHEPEWVRFGHQAEAAERRGMWPFRKKQEDDGFQPYEWGAPEDRLPPPAAQRPPPPQQWPGQAPPHPNQQFPPQQSPGQQGFPPGAGHNPPWHGGQIAPPGGGNPPYQGGRQPFAPQNVPPQQAPGPAWNPPASHGSPAQGPSQGPPRPHGPSGPPGPAIPPGGPAPGGARPPAPNQAPPPHQRPQAGPGHPVPPPAPQRPHGAPPPDPRRMQAPPPDSPNGTGRPHPQQSGPAPHQPPSNPGHPHAGAPRAAAPQPPNRAPHASGPIGHRAEQNVGRHDVPGRQGPQSSWQTPGGHGAQQRLPEPATDPNLPRLRAQDSGGAEPRPPQRDAGQAVNPAPERSSEPGADVNSVDARLNPDLPGDPAPPRARHDTDLDEPDFPEPRTSRHADDSELRHDVENERTGEDSRPGWNDDDHLREPDPADSGDRSGGDRPGDGAGAGEPPEHDSGAWIEDDHPSDRPSIDDLIPRDGAEFDAAEISDQVKRSIDGTYAGLRVDVHDVSVQSDTIGVTGKIFDSSGSQVGNFTRDLHRTADGLMANHRMLRLDEGVRAGGFARTFNESMEGWYRSSGVSAIKLHANIDVGSYAWARQGYDFAIQDQAVEKIRPRLAVEISKAKKELQELASYKSMPAGFERDAAERKFGSFRDEIDKAEELMGRFRVGHPNFPEPYDISDLFRPKGLEAGESKDISWGGKRVFMEPGKEIGWHGVKVL